MRKIEYNKEKQLKLILKYNPMLDDYYTGIRTISDIKNFNEIFNDVIDIHNEDDVFIYPDLNFEIFENAYLTGKIQVYSSHPIVIGTFITPSKRNAMDYAGGGRIYTKNVRIEDIAWIELDEGQYAPI